MVLCNQGIGRSPSEKTEKTEKNENDGGSEAVGVFWSW
jgi:hypothetical protein